MEIVRLNERLAFSEQPSFQELRALHRDAGFATLVNVRLENEQPSDEAEHAARVGMRYVPLPIAQREWNEAMFDALADVVDDPRRAPVLVHSAEGARAGILALTVHAADAGWTVEELGRAARQLGLDLPEVARAWLRHHGIAYDHQPLGV